MSRSRCLFVKDVLSIVWDTCKLYPRCSSGANASDEGARCIPSLSFLCRLRSIATPRDHFVRLSVRPSVTLSKAMFRRRHMHSSECCHYFLFYDCERPFQRYFSNIVMGHSRQGLNPLSCCRAPTPSIYRILLRGMPFPDTSDVLPLFHQMFTCSLFSTSYTTGRGGGGLSSKKCMPSWMYHRVHMSRPSQGESPSGCRYSLGFIDGISIYQQ